MSFGVRIILKWFSENILRATFNDSTERWRDFVNIVMKSLISSKSAQFFFFFDTMQKGDFLTRCRYTNQVGLAT